MICPGVTTTLEQLAYLGKKHEIQSLGPTDGISITSPRHALEHDLHSAIKYSS